MTGLTRTPLVFLALMAGATPLSTLNYTPTATVLTLEGATTGQNEPTTSWNEIMTGPICQQATTCAAVPYASYENIPGILSGVQVLTEALAQTDGEVVVFGYSNGAMVGSLWLAANRFNPDAPDPDDVSFLLVGNIFREHGGTLGFVTALLPESQYQVTDVTRQYDWLSDFPTNPFNVVALANAAMGYVTVHVNYHDVDLVDPASNPGAVSWTEGNTTYVFVPTENLPLLEPLRLAGMGDLADRLNGPLKVIVEAGYDRNLPETDGDPTGVAGHSLSYIPTNLFNAAWEAPGNEVLALRELANVLNGSDPSEAAKRTALVNVMVPVPALSEPLGEQLNSYASTMQFDPLVPGLAAFDSLTAPPSGTTAVSSFVSTTAGDHDVVGDNVAAPRDRLADRVSDTEADEDGPVEATTDDDGTGAGRDRLGVPARALIERVTNSGTRAGRDDDDESSRRPPSGALTSVRDRISSSIGSRTPTATGTERTAATPATRLRVPKTERQ